jgi:hypothetical protein
MAEVNSINIHRSNDELTVEIAAIDYDVKPIATIINYSGEIIKKIALNSGANKIDLKSYHSKNYSIRITNGKNVIVQKI